MRNDVYSLIEHNELTEDLQMIANVCGIESVKLLLREFGGMSFYVPKLTRLEKFVRKYVHENPDKSLKMIATELSVSEQYLKNMKFRKKGE